jgi:hydrogenase nickel incorporation protein HypA/HybF
MHEHGLMKDLMRKVLDVATKEKASRVISVSVWCGALSHMSKDHFRHHYDEIAAGTLAEHATLDITISDDADDPNAMDVLIKGIDVETEA